MNEFNIEHQYQLYLQRMELKESKMHPQQRKQLRQAFFGASGQMLILLRDEVSKLEDEEAAKVFKGMLNQVMEFFLSQANQKS